MFSFWSYLLKVIYITALIGVIFVLQTPQLNIDRSSLTKQEARKDSEQQRVFLKLMGQLPSLGFNNLVSDHIFLNFIQYFGDAKAREYTGYDLNPEYFRLIANKDPRFVHAYFILEPATTLFAGRPDLSVELLSQSLQYIKPQQPLSYQVWFYKAIDQLLFLNQLQSAKHSFQMAAEWTKYHDDPFSSMVGQRAREIVSFLEQNPDSKKAQASAWMSIFTNAREQQTRTVAIENIRRLGGELKIEDNKLILYFPQED